MLHCVLAVLSSISAPHLAPATEITVYAAASLRESMTEIGALRERDAPGTKIVFNFGSSGDLAKQIVAANKADLFFSADEKEMDRVGAEGLIAEGTRRVLLSNQLVVIEPFDRDHPDKSRFQKPFEMAQLSGPNVKRLSLANTEGVPAGRYAKAWLEKVDAWDAVKDRVLPAVDVRAALAAVESGGAQAGIVYRTDAAISKGIRIVHGVPLEEGPKVTYVVALMKDRPQAQEARAFADFLGSERSLDVFEKRGFLVPPEVKAAAKTKGVGGK